MTESPFMIETTALNTFVHPSSDVYVQFGVNQYVRKKARDIQEGDRIVVSVESIDKKPEEVYAVLSQHSLRYALAEQFLFETNSKGEKIPRLRTGIFRGLADETIPNHSAKILKDDDDFDPAAYDTVADTLEGIVSVHRKTVRNNWLQGSVIAPEDWSNFQALSAIGGREGDEFEKIYASFNQPLGFHAAYKLYVGLHSAVMSYLSKRTETSPNGSCTKSPQTSRGVFSPEIEAVVSSFFSEINSERIAVRVTKIHTIDGDKSAQSYKKPDPGLFKGIISDPSLPSTPMQEIEKRWYLLQAGIMELLNRQIELYDNISSRHYSSDEQQIFKYNVLPMFPLIVLSRFVSHPFNAQRLEILLHSSDNNDAPVIRRMSDDIYNQFYNNLLTGAVDRRFGFEGGTFATLFDTLSQYSSLIPKSCYEIMLNKHKRMALEATVKQKPGQARHERRQLQKEIDSFFERERQLIHYLGREYGIEEPSKKLFFDYHKGKYAEAKSASIHSADTFLDQSMLSDARHEYEEKGQTFFTYLEVEQCLREIGFKCIVPYYDHQNFRDYRTK